MEISYKSAKEQGFYEDIRALTARHGLRVAQKIVQRIGELQDAATPQQLPGSARFHEHTGSRKGLFSVDLTHPFRLIVSPTCRYDSYVEITSVQIYEVMDPH